MIAVVFGKTDSRRSNISNDKRDNFGDDIIVMGNDKKQSVKN